MIKKAKILRIQILSLMLLILLNASMPSLLFTILQLECRLKSFNDRKHSRMLVNLTFSKKYLKNRNNGIHFKHANEFYYRGCLYDIVRKKNLGDSIAYICYLDTKELGLINTYKNTKDHDSGLRVNSNVRLNFLTLFHFVDDNINVLFYTPRLFIQQLVEKIFKTFITIDTPPPEKRFLN